MAQAAVGDLPVERLVFCEQQEKVLALLAPQVCANLWSSRLHVG